MRALCEPTALHPAHYPRMRPRALGCLGAYCWHVRVEAPERLWAYSTAALDCRRQRSLYSWQAIRGSPLHAYLRYYILTSILLSSTCLLCCPWRPQQAKQVDKWVDEYKSHANFKYIFRENGRDVLNKQNPESVKRTLTYLAELC